MSKFEKYLYEESSESFYFIHGISNDRRNDTFYLNIGEKWVKYSSNFSTKSPPKKFKTRQDAKKYIDENDSIGFNSMGTILIHKG